MPCVTDAASQKQRPDNRFRQNSRSEIIRASTFVGSVTHLAEFIGADRIQSSPNERRQRQQITQVANAKVMLLVSKELIGAVGAETARAAEIKLRHADVHRAETGAPSPNTKTDAVVCTGKK